MKPARSRFLLPEGAPNIQAESFVMEAHFCRERKRAKHGRCNRSLSLFGNFLVCLQITTRRTDASSSKAHRQRRMWQAKTTSRVERRKKMVVEDANRELGAVFPEFVAKAISAEVLNYLLFFFELKLLLFVFFPSSIPFNNNLVKTRG